MHTGFVQGKVLVTHYLEGSGDGDDINMDSTETLLSLDCEADGTVPESCSKLGFGFEGRTFDISVSATRALDKI
jgi:hypothetical protein